MQATAQPPTKRGQEFALKAEIALREGKLDEAKLWHKNAWTAFKEARDGLMEGDSNTKMALKILIDYHRDREKNPGDPKLAFARPPPVIPPMKVSPPPDVTAVATPTSTSTNSLPEAWGAVQEFGEMIQSSVTPPPLPEFIPASKIHGMPIEGRKGNQSVMMAESFLLVGGDGYHGNQSNAVQIHSKSVGLSSPDRGQTQHRALVTEIERLSKEVAQLRSMIIKEREESKAQKDRFWKMFVLVKAALEESNHESDLKALTRLLHNETEARKKAEALLANVRGYQ
jgi:hypothetical protein